MGELTLYKDCEDGSTVISNCFIDCYLSAANDAQIKVYLYLLRMINANLPTSIADIADKFNHTEKDVYRSLLYWEQKGLLSLSYDEHKNLKGIRLLSPKSQEKSSSVAPLQDNDFTPFLTLIPEGISAAPTSASQIPAASVSQIPAASVSQIPAASVSLPQDPFERPDYSLDDLKAFKSREETSQLLFIAEQYLKKTLSANDIRTLLFISDSLHFSQDLIDYLLQYCVQRGKRDFRYIEKVAIGWATEHITTVKEAKSLSGRYDKKVYSIMNALGKSSAPTTFEVAYIRRWSDEFGFSQDIILEACERTVLATDTHRFEYADKILESWNKAGIHNKTEIQTMDQNYRKSKGTNTSKKNPVNSFNQFKQNEYDFQAIEQQLLNRK